MVLGDRARTSGGRRIRRGLRAANGHHDCLSGGTFVKAHTLKRCRSVVMAAHNAAIQETNDVFAVVLDGRVKPGHDYALNLRLFIRAPAFEAGVLRW